MAQLHHAWSLVSHRWSVKEVYGSCLFVFLGRPTLLFRKQNLTRWHRNRQSRRSNLLIIEKPTYSMAPNLWKYSERLQKLILREGDRDGARARFVRRRSFCSSTSQNIFTDTWTRAFDISSCCWTRSSYKESRSSISSGHSHVIFNVSVYDSHLPHSNPLNAISKPLGEGDNDSIGWLKRRGEISRYGQGQEQVAVYVSWKHHTGGISSVD